MCWYGSSNYLRNTINIITTPIKIRSTVDGSDTGVGGVVGGTTGGTLGGLTHPGGFGSFGGGKTLGGTPGGNVTIGGIPVGGLINGGIVPGGKLGGTILGGTVILGNTGGKENSLTIGVDLIL